MREFLVSRRGRITPEQAGLPAYGGNRRVAGLRREEVAMLAGISVEYYTRLERGNARGVSESVLEALARALQLDEAERAHLSTSSARPTPTPARRVGAQRRNGCGPTVQRILDAITGRRPTSATAASTSWPPTGSAARSTPRCSTAPAGRPTSPGSCSSTPRRRTSSATGTTLANDAVAILRAEAGRDPYDRRLSDLDRRAVHPQREFRVRWAAPQRRLHRTGVKHLHHPVVGDLTLAYESLELAADPGLRPQRLQPPSPAPPPRRR